MERERDGEREDGRETVRGNRVGEREETNRIYMKERNIEPEEQRRGRTFAQGS